MYLKVTNGSCNPICTCNAAAIDLCWNVLTEPDSNTSLIYFVLDIARHDALCDVCTVVCFRWHCPAIAINQSLLQHIRQYIQCLADSYFYTDYDNVHGLKFLYVPHNIILYAYFFFNLRVAQTTLTPYTIFLKCALSCPYPEIEGYWR